MVQEEVVEEEEACDASAKVFYRFLPVVNSAWDTVKIAEDRRCVYVSCGDENSPLAFHKYETDGVFHNSPQTEVYDALTNGGIIQSVCKGANGMILCFGQNYSGKTITASGLNNIFEDRGVALRVLEEIYKIKESEVKTAKHSLELKYVELSRNNGRNLLGNDDEGLLDALNIDGLKPTRVHSYGEAMELIFKGETMKTFRRRNSYLSNMANSVLTFIVTRKPHVISNTTTGILHVVDLCGADTEGMFCCRHKSGKEVGTGNLAKTQLGQLVCALRRRDGLDAMLKRRLNVLLYYLRDALNDHSILRFVGHIRASDDDKRVALSMLRFGQAIKGLEPRKLLLNVENDVELKLKILMKELCALKKENDLNAMLRNEDVAANLCQDRYEYVQRLAEDYLNNRCSEIVILSTTDAALAMKIFKEIHERTEAERLALLELSKQSAESQSASKHEGSIISKVSRKTSAMKSSMTSLNKPAKKAASKKSARGSKEVAEAAATAVDVSARSRQGSKISRRRSSKRKSTDSSHGLRSETSVNLSAVPGPPEALPTRADAWNSFAGGDVEYQALRDELEGVEQSLRDVFEAYKSEAEHLKEVNTLVNVRNDELFKANLLSDLDRAEDEPPTLSDMQAFCLENVKVAEEECLRQKEALLKVQTELKLVIDCKGKLVADIERKFDEYCKNQYGTSIPDLISTSGISGNVNLSELNEASNTANVEIVEKSEAIKHNGHHVDLKASEYNELRKHMKKEYSKRLWTSRHHRKWIQF